MSREKQELHDLVDALPDNMVQEVIDYIKSILK